MRYLKAALLSFGVVLPLGVLYVVVGCIIAVARKPEEFDRISISELIREFADLVS